MNGNPQVIRSLSRGAGPSPSGLLIRGTASRVPPTTLLTNIAQHWFQLLIDAMKEYAIYLLDADGHVATWNTGARRFKGYMEDEIVGRHFSVFYTNERRRCGRIDRRDVSSSTRRRGRQYREALQKIRRQTAKAAARDRIF